MSNNQPTVNLKPIETDARVFTPDMLTNVVFPYIPNGADKREILEGLNLCEVSFKDMLNCIRRTQAEGLCQNEFVSFVMCKNNREIAIAQRVKQWQEHKLSTLSPEEKKLELQNAENQMNSTIQKAADFCGSAELQEKHKKYCTQVISDLRGIKNWMSKLES